MDVVSITLFLEWFRSFTSLPQIDFFSYSSAVDFAVNLVGAYSKTRNEHMIKGWLLYFMLLDVDIETTEDESRPTKRRKARTSINHLSEHRPGTLYHLVGQYGGPESPTYVMQITVDGKVIVIVIVKC